MVEYIDIIYAAEVSIISGREAQVGTGQRLGLVNLYDILSHIVAGQTDLRSECSLEA